MRHAVLAYFDALRLRSERGQGMVEYSLILVLVSVASVAVLVLLGPAIVNLLQLVLNTLISL